MRFFVILMAAISLSGCDKIPGTIEYKAHAAIRELLKDPDSAQFHDLKVTGDTICGEVNARNSMGGYVGFRSYYYSTLGEAKGIASGDGPDFDEYLREVATGSEPLITSAVSKIFSACTFQDMHAIFCRDQETDELKASKRRCELAKSGDAGLQALRDDLRQ